MAWPEPEAGLHAGEGAGGRGGRRRPQDSPARVPARIRGPPGAPRQAAGGKVRESFYKTLGVRRELGVRPGAPRAHTKIWMRSRMGWRQMGQALSAAPQGAHAPWPH